MLEISSNSEESNRESEKFLENRIIHSIKGQVMAVHIPYSVFNSFLYNILY